MEKFDWLGEFPGKLVIGVDEVGRGCLAGPVFSAACIINQDAEFTHYTDSKKISPKKRKTFSEEILSNHKVSLASASVEEIDQINILKASLLSMKRAVEGLGVQGGVVLIDGNFKIPGLDPAFHQVTLIKGDLRAEPVAAASIVAKVHRDELISSYEKEFPGYGLAGHKGYSTKVHKEAIAKLGPTPIHRRSFSGVKEHLKT